MSSKTSSETRGEASASEFDHLPRMGDSGPRVLFTWVTLADLAFDAAHAADKRILLETIARDIGELLASQGLTALDAVVLAGDTAGSGLSAEFADAAAALSAFADRAGLPPTRIYAVPGDRDIDRTSSESPLARYVLHAHREPRMPSSWGPPWRIDEALSQDKVRDVLMTRQVAYMRFADRLATLPERRWWTACLPERAGVTLRLIGLNTALLATGDDFGRLAVGTTQLDEIRQAMRASGNGSSDEGKAEVVVGISHHALDGGWLADATNVGAFMRRECQVLIASNDGPGNRVESTSAANGGSVLQLRTSLHQQSSTNGPCYVIAAVIADDDRRLKVRLWPRRASSLVRFATDRDVLGDGGDAYEHPLRLSLPVAARPRSTHGLPASEEGGHRLMPAARVLSFITHAMTTPGEMWRRLHDNVAAEERSLWPEEMPPIEQLPSHLVRVLARPAATDDAALPMARVASAILDEAGTNADTAGLGAALSSMIQSAQGGSRVGDAPVETDAPRVQLRMELGRSFASVESALTAIRRVLDAPGMLVRRLRRGSAIVTAEVPLADAARWFHELHQAQPGMGDGDLGLRRMSVLVGDESHDLPLPTPRQDDDVDPSFVATSADRDVAAMIESLQRTESAAVAALGRAWFVASPTTRLLAARSVRNLLPVFGDDLKQATEAIGAVAGRVERPAEALALLARFDGTVGPDDETLRRWLRANMPEVGGERVVIDRPRPALALRGASLLDGLRALLRSNGRVMLPETALRPAMVRIPAGSFLMGSPDDDPVARRWEQPQHRVTLTRDYLLSATPVTVGQYAAVMGDRPSLWRDEQLPVTDVSWHDAVAFCNALSEREGLRLAYEGEGDAVSRVEGADGYRLPTEAEWEHACRAGTTSRYWSGDDEAALDAVGWYAANSGGRPHPVGEKLANPWGLHDMHGNVWEWVDDRYGPYGPEPLADPVGPPTGVFRVVRGGSFDFVAVYARSAVRYWWWPRFRFDWFGFRLARPAPSPGLDP